MRRRSHVCSGTDHGHVAQAEVLNLQKIGQFTDEFVKIEGVLCNLPDVLAIEDIKEIELGGLLL